MMILSMKSIEYKKYKYQVGEGMVYNFINIMTKQSGRCYLLSAVLPIIKILVVVVQNRKKVVCV